MRFPQLLKTAHVRPLLKTPHLDPEDFSNYMPVSNLPFPTKVIEKVVATRLNLHFEKHDIQEEYQSAYWSYCLEISASQGMPYSGSDHTRVQSDTSTSMPLTRGVPQGSVLYPLLFSIYAMPIISIFRSYGLPCHSYADDTTYFIAVKAKQRDLGNVVNRIADCLFEVREWMDANFLTLNGKAEVVL